MPFDVLDHDDGAVDHHADGDGQSAEGHQVGGDAEPAHADEGDKDRERNRERHHEAGSEAAHEDGSTSPTRTMPIRSAVVTVLTAASTRLFCS